MPEPAPRRRRGDDVPPRPSRIPASATANSWTSWPQRSSAWSWPTSHRTSPRSRNLAAMDLNSRVMPPSVCPLGSPVVNAAGRTRSSAETRHEHRAADRWVGTDDGGPVAGQVRRGLRRAGAVGQPRVSLQPAPSVQPGRQRRARRQSDWQGMQICPQKCPQNSRSESRQSTRWRFEPLLPRPGFAGV